MAMGSRRRQVLRLPGGQRADIDGTSRAVSGYPAQHLGAEFGFSLELAQNADSRRRYAVDQNVRRWQIELASDIRSAQVSDPACLGSHPFSVKGKGFLLRRVGERREKVLERGEVDCDTW